MLCINFVKRCHLVGCNVRDYLYKSKVSKIGNFRISDVCDKIGADKDRVLDSVGSDSRIGNKYFRPGYSFGGPCFPRDTRALALFVDSNSVNNDLLLSTSKLH